MKKLHLKTFICAFLLLGDIFVSCANNAVKNEETTTNQETVTEYENFDSVTDEEDLSEQMSISPIADTICIVNGKVFYYGSGETVDPGMIFDEDKVWLDAPALTVFPYSDTSSYSFYVCTPFKRLLIDFSDENSLAQLSSLTEVLPNFERNTQSFVSEDSIAWYDFEVDFPTSSVANSKAIRKWLVGKIAESNRNDADLPFPTAIYINYRKGPEGVWEYMGDLMNNQQITQFAADVYFAIIESDYGDLEEEFIPTGLSRTLNMQAKMCNKRFVTYQECTFDYGGGAHGYYTEKLLSFDHVNNQEIDNSYLFKSGYEEELVNILVEEALRSPNYQVSETSIRSGVANLDEEGNPIGSYTFPQPGLSEEGVVFSFQPYEISCFADGTFHFVIPYERLKHILTDWAKWCLGME